MQRFLSHIDFILLVFLLIDKVIEDKKIKKIDKKSKYIFKLVYSFKKKRMSIDPIGPCKLLNSLALAIPRLSKT